GPAGGAAFGALLDLDADAPIPVAPPWTPTPIPTTGELLGDNLRRRRQQLGRGWSGLAPPGRALRGARAAWRGWREVFPTRRAPPDQPHPAGRGRPPAGHHRRPP